jgi:hypothetical protein
MALSRLSNSIFSPWGPRSLKPFRIRICRIIRIREALFGPSILPSRNLDHSVCLHPRGSLKNHNFENPDNSPRRCRVYRSRLNSTVWPSREKVHVRMVCRCRHSLSVQWPMRKSGRWGRCTQGMRMRNLVRQKTATVPFLLCDVWFVAPCGPHQAILGRRTNV